MSARIEVARASVSSRCRTTSQSKLDSYAVVVFQSKLHQVPNIIRLLHYNVAHSVYFCKFSIILRSWLRRDKFYAVNTVLSKPKKPLGESDSRTEEVGEDC